MTPQLYQAIRIMALPLQDLKLTIQEELEKNPALEVVSDATETPLETQEDQPDDDGLYDNSSDPGMPQQADADAKHRFMEGALSRPESLQDHLLWQLRLQPISPDEFRVGELLIRNLDERGFHREDPAGLVLSSDLTSLRKMLELIQELDPVGTCTANYRESLLAQIRIHPEPHPISSRIVADHWELAERAKLPELTRKLKISESEVKEALAFIRQLDPIPGRNFSQDGVRYVIPDVLVKVLDGELVIVLNDEVIPVLGVNSFFQDLSNQQGAGGVRKFVNSNLQEARWFIRSIRERNRSMLKVTRAVVEFQREFFRRGAKYLVPLTLKDVASEVGVHEATVSRIANGKYLQTEWGIFELRYFFTNSISGSGSTGSRFSKEGVKQVVKEIIQEESDGKPLSDSKIQRILDRRGIRIARRTVAKYRRELDITSSFHR